MYMYDNAELWLVRSWHAVQAQCAYFLPGTTSNFSAIIMLVSLLTICNVYQIILTQNNEINNVS